MSSRTGSPLLRVLDWIIPLAVVLGFFWLQVRLGQIASGRVHNVLMAASAITEIGLIGLWERWSTRRALA